MSVKIVKIQCSSNRVLYWSTVLIYTEYLLFGIARTLDIRVQYYCTRYKIAR
jgi:hypothetical protein